MGPGGASGPARQAARVDLALLQDREDLGTIDLLDRSEAQRSSGEAGLVGQKPFASCSVERCERAGTRPEAFNRQPLGKQQGVTIEQDMVKTDARGRYDRADARCSKVGQMTCAYQRAGPPRRADADAMLAR